MLALSAIGSGCAPGPTLDLGDDRSQVDAAFAAGDDVDAGIRAPFDGDSAATPSSLGDAAASSPLPDGQAGFACAESVECPAETPYCDSAGQCLECTTEGGCDGDEYCVAGRCVECMDDLDCAEAEEPYCGARGECIECRQDVECGAESDGSFCDQGYGCVECRSDADCVDTERPFCDPSEGCVECVEDAQCSDPDAGG